MGLPKILCADTAFVFIPFHCIVTSFPAYELALFRAIPSLRKVLQFVRRTAPSEITPHIFAVQIRGVCSEIQARLIGSELVSSIRGFLLSNAVTAVGPIYNQHGCSKASFVASLKVSTVRHIETSHDIVSARLGRIRNHKLPESACEAKVAIVRDSVRII